MEIRKRPYCVDFTVEFNPHVDTLHVDALHVIPRYTQCVSTSDVITSRIAEEVMFLVPSICLYVCVSVCAIATESLDLWI